MVEMCLMGYKMIILDDAFLVHWPGIKRKTIRVGSPDTWLRSQQRLNARRYHGILETLAIKYPQNDKCKL